MEGYGEPYEIIFVNDGSFDDTLKILAALAAKDNRLRIIDFSRNFGHQIAISAGMDYADGDTVTIIDADLQDPPELIPQMSDKWKQGFEVVYAKRKSATGISPFKKWTSKLYYRLLQRVCDTEIPNDVGDFRLIDRKVCLTMRKLKEKRRYMRGLSSWVGYRQTSVEFERGERLLGETKYTLRNMLRLAADGIISFSSLLLKIPLYLGTIVTVGGIIGLIITIIRLARMPNDFYVPDIFIPLLFTILGVTLISIGVLGCYMAVVLEEARDRPLYIVRDTIGFSNE